MRYLILNKHILPLHKLSKIGQIIKELLSSKGEITYDGSGGNHQYTFLNGQFAYTCSIEVLGEGDSPGELIVRKNGRDVLVQQFITLDN